MRPAGHQTQERPSRRRLAAAGFAHNANDLPRRDFEADVAHREHLAPRGREGDLQVLHRKDSLAVHAPDPRVRGLVAAWIASPSRLKAMMVTNKARPGKLATHQRPVVT